MLKNSETWNWNCYLQTKIYQTKKSTSELLDCIDGMGLAIATINGTEKGYVEGTNVEVQPSKKITTDAATFYSGGILNIITEYFVTKKLHLHCPLINI